MIFKQFAPLRNEAAAGDGGGGAAVMAGFSSDSAPAANAAAGDGSAAAAGVDPAAAAAPADWAATEEFLSDARFQGKDLTKFLGKSQGDIVESYMNLEAFKGTPPAAVQIPNAETTPEGITAYRSANGIPETAEGYEMTMPEQMPDGVSINDASMASYKESFLKHNLSPAQAQGIMEDHLALAGSDAGQQLKAMDEAHKTNVANLRNEWGASYDSNLANAHLAVQSLTEATGEAIDPSLTNNPAFVKYMAHVHSMTAESSSSPHSSTPTGNHTMAEAKALMNDMDGAYWNEHDPGHAEAVNVVRSAQANQRT